MIGKVSFDGKDSYSEYGLLLAKKEVDLPQVQTNMQLVPGRDGLLDLSAALDGEIHYKNRTIKLTFVAAKSEKAWADILSTFCSAVHGQNCKIIFGEDTGHYYTGRCTVSKHTLSGGMQKIVVTCDCQPFRAKVAETSVSKSLTTTDTTITLSNGGRPVTPKIECTAETVLTWQGSSTAVSAGTHTVPAIRLSNGSNDLKAKTKSGTGKITIRWNEVSL